MGIDTGKTITMLGQAEKILSEIGNLIENYDIYSRDTSETILREIGTLQDKVKLYLNKLKRDELEVAFAGVEKSGKSTFVNAFIGRDLLPTADKRATYTVTEVRYDRMGKVEVSFFSEKEFNQQILRGLLKKVKYKNLDVVNLRTFSLRNLEEHENFLKNEMPEVYQAERVKSLKDLREIVEGKKEILKLLDSDPAVFNEDDDRFKPFIVDRYKSRAVKRVVIYSPRLENLQNIVIYDLPGFDSPTFIHSKFTVESLKKVDAVVVVRDARKPSLTGPEVEIITETYEEDGVPLKDKAFFFLNRIDELKTREKVDKVRQEFEEELKRNGLFKGSDRIIAGSALGHLAEIGVENSKDARVVLEDLERLGFSTGIEKVKEKLVAYNKTERRKILLRRIDSVRARIKNLLEEISNNLNEKVQEGDFRKQYMKLAVEEIAKFKLNFRNQLNQVLDAYKSSVLTDEPISAVAKEQIDELAILPSEDEIRKIRLEVQSVSSTAEERPDAFNAEIRRYLRKKLRKQFLELSETTLKKFLSEFHDRVVREFMTALNISENDDKARAVIDDFLEKNVKNFSREIFAFDMLVVRFSGDIIDLLMIPLSSQDRRNKFKAVNNEVYSLYAFYDFFDPETPPITSQFVRMILEQKMPPEVKKVKQVVSEFVSSVGLTPTDELNNSIIKFVLNSKMEISEWIETFRDNVYLEEIKKALENSASPAPVVILNKLRKLVGKSKKEEKMFNPKVPSTYQEVMEEVERDIEILKYLFKHAVIKAIGFEKAFMNFITDYVNYMFENVISETTGVFNRFFIDNIEIISPEKIEVIKEKESVAQIFAALREKVENLKRNIAQTEVI